MVWKLEIQNIGKIKSYFQKISQVNRSQNNNGKVKMISQKQKGHEKLQHNRLVNLEEMDNFSHTCN